METEKTNFAKQTHTIKWSNCNLSKTGQKSWMGAANLGRAGKIKNKFLVERRFVSGKCFI